MLSTKDTDDPATAADALAGFAYRKAELIAARVDPENRRHFWHRLANFVNKQSRGRLGRRIAELKLDLGRSQRANATAHAELGFTKERMQKQIDSCEGDVRILRSVLAQALECMTAAKFNRPWRGDIDEVMARTRTALRTTERKPKLGATAE